MRRNLLRLAPLALALACANACGSPSAGAPSVQRSSPRAPGTFSGFPDGSTDRSVWVEARIVDDPVQTFGADLSALGVLPVDVRVGHLDVEWEQARLSRDTFDAHLYLPDGTVIGWLGSNTSGQPAVVRRAEGLQGLTFSLLPPWDDAEQGYLFFRLVEGMRVQDGWLVIEDESGARRVPLEGSLLSFRIETATGSREVRVGVRLEGP